MTTTTHSAPPAWGELVKGLDERLKARSLTGGSYNEVPLQPSRVALAFHPRSKSTGTLSLHSSFVAPHVLLCFHSSPSTRVNHSLYGNRITCHIIWQQKRNRHSRYTWAFLLPQILSHNNFNPFYSVTITTLHLLLCAYFFHYIYIYIYIYIYFNRAWPFTNEFHWWPVLSAARIEHLFTLSKQSE